MKYEGIKKWRLQGYIIANNSERGSCAYKGFKGQL